MAAWEAVKDVAKKTAKKEEPKTSQDFYLLGVDAYKNNDYKTAIDYFDKALKLDPGNKKAKEGLGKAQQLLRGIPEAKERSDVYLRAAEAYKNEKYDLAAAYFYLALRTDGEMAQKNLEKAKKQGGDVDAGMAALRLQNLPDPLMQMVFAYYKEKDKEKEKGPPTGAKPSKEPSKQAKGKEGPPTEVEEKTLRTFSDGSSLVRIGAYLNHEGLSELGKLLGIPHSKKDECLGSLLPGGPNEAAGVYWRQTIGELFKDKNADYIGGRKLGPGNYELLFYSNGHFYLVNAKIEDKDVPILYSTRIMSSSPKYLVFTFKELSSDEFAELGLKYVRKV